MTIGKMKAKTNNETCCVCGKNSELAPNKEGKLCPICLSMVEILKSKPDTFQKLSKIAGVSDLSSLESKHVEQELPDVLDGVRYRTTDRERNTWYVSISELDGNPVEIFASTAFDRDHHLQSRISNLTTITRLISLILRHVFLGEKLTLEKTLTQLERSSRQPNDLPEMLGKVLANYKKSTSTSSDSETANEQTVSPKL
jgi:hypothetical protein